MSDPTTAETPLDLRGFGYAPGNYYCRCRSCEEMHTADKRAQRCKPCALKAKAEYDAKPPAETPTMLPESDHVQLVRRFWDAMHHEGEAFDDASGHEKHMCYLTVARVLTGLEAMGYVIAKLEGKVR